jgi:glycosyltransferase involved in cell wall biosynthesis
MNVLLLANELRYTCGVTNHLLHLAKGLSESGDVKLFIICGGGNGIYRFKDIDVEIISDERFLHMNRNFSTFISAINYLVRFTGKKDIKLYHSHTHYAAAIAKRASILTRVKTIQTNHGILADKSRLKPFNADRYIAINGHIMSYILENNIAALEDAAFIRCGIPLRKHIPLKNKGYLKITAASRLVHEKGLDIYIKAISLLPEHIRMKADFFIAGEGEQEEELKELDSSLGTKIHFTGRITDMTGFLSDTHILVHPSRSKNEGFPAILTEAGDAGCLVVSSNFEGVKDVIEDGVNGLLFEKENPEYLSQILNKVMSDFESYKLHAKSFQKKINEEFMIETMIKKHLELYKKCLLK